MNTNYNRLANAMVFLHLVWFAIGIAALPLVLSVAASQIFIRVFVIGTVLSWIIWKGCVFRIWENDFRRRHDTRTAYQGTFSSHYLKRTFGISVPDTLVRMSIYIYLALLLLLSLR